MQSSPEKMKLWTRQHIAILKELDEDGVYYVKEDYIRQKLDTITPFYLRLYKWYRKMATRIVPAPEKAKFPIWLSMSDELMLRPTEDSVVLEIEVDCDQVVVLDYEKWGYIVNCWYLPLNDEDEKKHNQELQRIGISDESALFLTDKGNFYPLMKQKIEKSWERLFDDSVIIGNVQQATLWEIRKEWVVNVHYYQDA